MRTRATAPLTGEQVTAMRWLGGAYCVGVHPGYLAARHCDCEAKPLPRFEKPAGSDSLYSASPVCQVVVVEHPFRQAPCTIR